jgi:hypothetical protein
LPTCCQLAPSGLWLAQMYQERSFCLDFGQKNFLGSSGIILAQN